MTIRTSCNSPRWGLKPLRGLCREAYGIKAVQCSKEADLPQAPEGVFGPKRSEVIEEWLTFDGPMLVDFKVVRGHGSQGLG